MAVDLLSAASSRLVGSAGRRTVDLPNGSQLQIGQLRAVEQAPGDQACGFYCLFFLDCIIRASHCAEQSAADELMALLCEAGAT